jgi:hypothetical protein
LCRKIRCLLSISVMYWIVTHSPACTWFGSKTIDNQTLIIVSYVDFQPTVELAIHCLIAPPTKTVFENPSALLLTFCRVSQYITIVPCSSCFILRVSMKKHVPTKVGLSNSQASRRGSIKSSIKQRWLCSMSRTADSIMRDLSRQAFGC